ncbi:MAG: gliding motility-associated C-terminal domain-containing protein [Bacteroidetes bacterium]|nr:gliding motility-associated C-terminal domain-containing protein [Bacteroidota bacterium]
MLNLIKKISVAAAFALIAQPAFSQGNEDCDQMEPICTDAGLAFTAQTGVSIEPGNDYGCLFSQPNPTWYYFEIATAGIINMELFAPSDIDFIIWGPFTDLTEAISYCGQMGVSPNAPEVDCSYSGTNDEFPVIPSAQVGEVYVMLITNYASVVQDVTLTALPSSTGATDCDIIVPDPCVSNPGTYTVEKNGALTTAPIYLCEGETFGANSNGDYILPNDTIPAPTGDGGYSAQLMWLVYDAAPTGADPSTDPGFLNVIIPSEDLADVNNGTSPIVAAFGCGTYWFVPVAGDDGIGANGNVANGTTDNGGLHWDKNSNDCYLLGTPLEVTFACEIQTTTALDCNPPTTINGMDILVSGGTGPYTIVNQGGGNLTPTSLPLGGGTANVNNLTNNEGWEIDITDSEGCTTTASGVFSAPIISNITITPAPTCPGASPGQVDVTVNGTSGNGAPYTIVMAGDPPTAGTTDSYSDLAGTLVNIVVSDQEGCISDSVVTITSAGHFIDVQVVSLQGELCYGDGNGAAQISAVPTPTGNLVSITWNGPSGQTPGGNPGGPANNSQSGLEPGNWSVTIIDDLGCEVTIPIVITSPQELDLYVSNSNEPTCYAYSDGSITVQSTGGSGGLTYSWVPANTVPGNTFNNLDAGIYWAYVTDANGCEDSVMYDLGQPDSLYGNFTIKDVLCYGDSTGAIIVDSVSNAVGNVSYFWNLSGVVPNPPSTSNIANGLPVGTYVLTIQDALCYNQYEFTLTQNPEITFAELGTEPAYCRMFSYQSGNGVVYASATGGVPDYTYEWINLATGANTNNTTWGGLNPGSYQITVTDDVGCTLVQTVELDSVSPIADFTIVSSQLDLATLSGTAVVCAQYQNNSQYFANPNDPNADTTFFWELGYNQPWQISHDVNEVFDTCYYTEAQYTVCLVALNKNGCSDTSCQVLTIYDFPQLIAPNVFTPGAADGANDVFTFDYRQIAIVEFECTITDRWGREMFVFDDITDEWNGDTKNGKPASAGVYFYTYRGVSSNGTEFKGMGTCHLIR